MHAPQVHHQGLMQEDYVVPPPLTWCPPPVMREPAHTCAVPAIAKVPARSERPSSRMVLLLILPSVLALFVPQVSRRGSEAASLALRVRALIQVVCTLGRGSAFG